MQHAYKENSQSGKPTKKGLLKKLKNKALQVLSVFTKKKITIVSNGAVLTASSLPQKQSSNIVLSIKKLTLDRFISCNVSEGEDYSALIVDDKGDTTTKDELKKAWLSLLSQYYTVREDSTAIQFIELQRLIEAKKLRLIVIQEIILSLQKFYNPALCEVFRKSGYDYPFTIESYLQDLQCIENGEKMNVLEIREMQKRLEGLGGGIKKKAKEEDYENMLLSLSEYMKVDYNSSEIFTYKYALLCKRYEEHVERLNLSNNGSK